jgi:gliding motility-associated-like protein
MFVIAHLVIVTGVLWSSQATAQVGFPYCESFQGGRAQSTTVFGEQARLVSGALRLTDTSIGVGGYVYIDIPFSSSFGIKASFEYFTYGGTGADGLTIFLFDALVTNFFPGGFGGAMGYGPGENTPGLSGGYVGIGLDTWGNFGNLLGGLGGFPGGPYDLHPNSVVIRGPSNTGYRFIAGKKVNEGGGLGLPATDRFPLSSGAQRVTDPNTVGYRKVFVDLKPAASGVGYDLSLDMQVTTAPGSPRMVSILKSVPYPYVSPRNLKIGFAAATGGFTNFHEIRNLQVEVSDEESLLEPIGKDLQERASCEGQENEYEIDASSIILPNDNSEIQCLQFYESLEEIEAEAEDLCSQGKCRPENRVLEFPQGTVRAAEIGGEFTFFPLAGSDGEEVTLYYTVTDNYGKTSAGNSLTFSINTSPEPILLLADNLPLEEWNLCPGEEVQLSAVGEEEYVSYEWYRDETPIVGAAGSQFTATQPGSYQVWGYNEQGCPSKSSSLVVEQPPFPELELLKPVVACFQEERINLREYILDIDETQYDYRVKKPDGAFLVNEEMDTVYIDGNYELSVKFKDMECWSDPLTFRIRVVNIPVEASFDYGINGSDRKSDEEGGVLIDDPIWFTDASTGRPIAWKWDFGDGKTSMQKNPIHVFGEKGDFLVSLTASNEAGCESVATMYVTINRSYRVMFPTGFTPTSEQNTHFRPKTKGIVSMELLVFNGWGELLFQSEDVNTLGWDGTVNGSDAPPGSYVFRVNMEARDGEAVVKSGKFLLVR